MGTAAIVAVVIAVIAVLGLSLVGWRYYQKKAAASQLLGNHAGGSDSFLTTSDAL